MGWDKAQTVALGLFLTGVLSFTVWAGTSINQLNTSTAVSQREDQQLRETLASQQSQIASFNHLLGQINADVKVIKAIMEERDKRDGGK